MIDPSPPRPPRAPNSRSAPSPSAIPAYPAGTQQQPTTPAARCHPWQPTTAQLITVCHPGVRGRDPAATHNPSSSRLPLATHNRSAPSAIPAYPAGTQQQPTTPAARCHPWQPTTAQLITVCHPGVRGRDPAATHNPSSSRRPLATHNRSAPSAIPAYPAGTQQQPTTPAARCHPWQPTTAQLITVCHPGVRGRDPAATHNPSSSRLPLATHNRSAPSAIPAYPAGTQQQPTTPGARCHPWQPITSALHSHESVPNLTNP